MTRKAAPLWVVGLIAFTLAHAVAVADEHSDNHELKIFFQFTVRGGPSAGLIANGVLTLNVNLGTGNFTGNLTPGADQDTGEPLTTVLFDQVDNKFVPDPAGVKQLDVRGTLHGHAANMVLLDVRGEGKDIFGVGSTENAFGDAQGLGHIAGPGVGPEEGDSGDWIISIQPIPRLQPPAINSVNSATFSPGAANSFTVTALGVPASSFSETGTLPSGVTFASTGVLTGNPSATGTFPITITASNGVPPNATQSFTLVVSTPTTTFSSELSAVPVNVASFSIDTTNHVLSMTVTAGANPTTFNTFAANALQDFQDTLHGTIHRFNGTLSISGSNMSFTGMFVSALSESLSPSSDSLKLVYQ